MKTFSSIKYPNTKAENKKNQAFVKKDLKKYLSKKEFYENQRRFLRAKVYLHPDVFKNLDYFLDKLTDSELLVLNYLIGMAASHDQLLPSQTRIGNNIGFERRTVIRALNRLRAKGLVASHKRYNNTSFYKISDIFYSSTYRHTLCKYFKNLSFLKYLTFFVYIQPIFHFSNVTSNTDNKYTKEKLTTSLKKLIISQRDYVETRQERQDEYERMITDDYHKWEKRKDCLKGASCSLVARDELKDIFSSEDINVERYERDKRISKIKELKELVAIYEQEEQFEALLQESRPMPTSFKQSRDDAVPEYIRAITCMKLTKWGQIKAAAFPVEAIAHAAEHVHPDNTLDDPFGYFVKKATQWCERHDIKPDWQFMYDRFESFNKPVGAPYIFKKVSKVSHTANNLRKNRVIPGREKYHRVNPAYNTKLSSQERIPYIKKEIEAFMQLIATPPAEHAVLGNVMLNMWKSCVVKLTNELEQCKRDANQGKSEIVQRRRERNEKKAKSEKAE